MGNMVSSRRVQESLHLDDSGTANDDKRLFPSHMYTVKTSTITHMD